MLSYCNIAELCHHIVICFIELVLTSKVVCVSYQNSLIGHILLLFARGHAYIPHYGWSCINARSHLVAGGATKLNAGFQINAKS